jgi:YetF C-terminal domain
VESPSRPRPELSKLSLLLVANGAVLPDNLRKVKISEGEVRQQLRLAGVHRYDDVAALILERTGAVSVLRRGETIAPDFVADVRGRDLLASAYSAITTPTATCRQFGTVDGWPGLRLCKRLLVSLFLTIICHSPADILSERTASSSARFISLAHAQVTSDRKELDTRRRKRPAASPGRRSRAHLLETYGLPDPAT